MRNPLNKRFKRDIRMHSGRYAAILIIFIVMVTIISSFLVTSNGVRISYENDHIENSVEDGQFSSQDIISDDAISAVEDLGITVLPQHYLDLEVLSGQTLRLYQPRTETNIPTIWEGTLPESSNEIAVERLFAEKHSLSVGDIIQISGNDMIISGLISVPDYSSLFIKNTDLMMDAFGFGVAITTPESFLSLSQENVIYNYSYRYNDREMTEQEQIELSDTIKKILVKNDVRLTGFIMAKDNQSISFVANDMGSDVPMMKTFLYIIQIIMAFVFTVIIISSVESDAAAIGTLLASGYSKWQLIRHYLMLPALVTLIGALIGNVLSYTAGLPMFRNIYYGTYSLPPMELHFHLEAFLLTTLLPILLLLLVNTIVLYRKLSLSPLKFIRRDLRRTKQKRAVVLPKLSFISRFRLRVILQNLGSYVILFFGMLFASFILIFGLCMKPTVEKYVASIESAAVSEYQYILKAPYTETVSEDAEAFAMHTLETYYSRQDRQLEVSLYGVPVQTDYCGVDTEDIGDTSIIISDGLSKKLDVKAGDTISFSDPYTGESYTLNIAGIKDYPAGFAAFMEQEAMTRMLKRDDGWISGYLSNEVLNIPSDYIATVITPEDMSKLGNQMLSTFSQMSEICLGAAIVIYLVLMYILTKVIVEKNAQNMSLMKVMGYQDNEISKLYLTSTVIAVLVSLVVSLPLINVGLQGAFGLALSKISGYIETYLPWYLFVIVVATGFVSYMLINLLHVRTVRRIGLAEVLKTRE